MKRLPDTELEVMKALWVTGPDTPRSVLEDRLAPFGWVANTINTYLSRLADKGFVSVRREGNRTDILAKPLLSVPRPALRNGVNRRGGAGRRAFILLSISSLGSRRHKL